MEAGKFVLRYLAFVLNAFIVFFDFKNNYEQHCKYKELQLDH